MKVLKSKKEQRTKIIQGKLVMSKYGFILQKPLLNT